MHSGQQGKRGGLLLGSFLMVLAIATFSLVACTTGGASAASGARQHPKADLSVNCVECHAQETPQAVKDWRASKHGVMNYGCYMCHGDGQVEFYVHPGTGGCISCHSAVHDGEIESTDFKECFSCHNGHTLANS